MELVSIGIGVMLAALTIASTKVPLAITDLQYKKISGNEIRVACIGDSITMGSGYPSHLDALLGANYTVRNFGVTGSTVSLSSVRPYMFQDEFLQAKEFQPDIVIIMLGTNDANPNLQPYTGNFEDDYTELVAAFQQLEGEQQIWVVKSPPVFNNTCNISPTYFRENVIPHIENLANDLNLPTIDVYGAFGNNPDYCPDGVHPTSEGAAVIASRVYDALTSNNNYVIIP